MFLPKRERELERKLMERFWETFQDVRRRCRELIEDRIVAGYNEHGFWRTYSFPGGIMGMVAHKYMRVANILDGKAPEELLDDKVLLDNLLDLSNYAALFATELLLLAEEEART